MLSLLELLGDMSDMRALAIVVSRFSSFSSPSLLPLLVPLALRIAMSVFLLNSARIVPARSPLPRLKEVPTGCVNTASPRCLGTLTEGTSSIPLDAVLAGDPSSSVIVPFFPPVSFLHFLLGANRHL